MIIFGLMVRSYGNNNLVFQFLFFWSSGFGLMDPPLPDSSSIQIPNVQSFRLYFENLSSPLDFNFRHKQTVEIFSFAFVRRFMTGIERLKLVKTVFPYLHYLNAFPKYSNCSVFVSNCSKFPLIVDNKITIR